MRKFLKNNIFLILTVLLSVPSVVALFHFGFYGASDDLHVAWLFEMDKIIRMGQIPPRFVPDLSFGFGYPLFNFAFPLPFYLGEIFHLVGFTLVDSIKIVFGLSLIGSGVAMYLLLNQFVSKFFSLAGTLVYVYTPYRSTDVYIRGAFGESLTFVFLPLLLWAAVKIYKSSLESKKIDWKSASVIALSLAALVLTHDIVSYMFFPFFLLFILFLLILSKWKKVLLWGNLAGVAGGLLISLYFWLPAIVESRLMTYGTVFNFVDHFPTIRQLFTPYFGYGASVAGPYDLLSFFMGTLNIFLIFAGGAIALLKWKKISPLDKTVMVWLTAVFLITFFFMNHRSAFLWEVLPFFPYFQFPWRFLTLITLTSVIFLIPFKYLNLKKLNFLIPGLLAVLAITLNYNYFKPHDFLERTDGYYINRYVPVPFASEDYYTTQEEYLRLPKDNEKRPDRNYPVVYSEKDFDFEIVETNGMYSKINVSLGDETRINYSKYYFPGWYAKINGKNTDIAIGKPFGQISITVPEGNHVLEFGFSETPVKIVLDIVSLAALLVAFILIFKKSKK
jgi:hypothetical protein